MEKGENERTREQEQDRPPDPPDDLGREERRTAEQEDVVMIESQGSPPKSFKETLLGGKEQGLNESEAEANDLDDAEFSVVFGEDDDRI